MRGSSARSRHAPTVTRGPSARCSIYNLIISRISAAARAAQRCRSRATSAAAQNARPRNSGARVFRRPAAAGPQRRSKRGPSRQSACPPPPAHSGDRIRVRAVSRPAAAAGRRGRCPRNARRTAEHRLRHGPGVCAGPVSVPPAPRDTYYEEAKSPPPCCPLLCLPPRARTSPLPLIHLSFPLPLFRPPTPQIPA